MAIGSVGRLRRKLGNSTLDSLVLYGIDCTVRIVADCGLTDIVL